MESSFDVQSHLLNEERKEEVHETKDGFLTQLAKRLYSVAPLLVMAYTTINQVFVIVTSLSSQSSVETYYNDFVEVRSNDRSSYYTCEYGDAKAVVVYCPYYSIDAFIGILSLWVAYFVLFIFIRLAATYKYSTDDLRFYIAVDQYNSHLINRTFVYLGIVLTIVSAAIAVYYMSPGTKWNPTVDNTSLLNIFLFVGINFLALSGFRKQFINAHQAVVMSDFKQFVPIYHSRIWYGVDRVVTPVLVSYMLYLSTDNTAELEKHGSVKLLRETLMKLYKLEPQ